MASSINPSFFVTFLPLRMKIRAHTDPTTKNILAIKNGEISRTTNGDVNAIIPNTKVDVIITDPIKSPNTSQFSSFLAEIMEKYISGKQLPRPTIKIPTKPREIPNLSEKYCANPTTACEASKSKPKMIMIFMMLNKNPLNPETAVLCVVLYTFLNRSFLEKIQTA